MPPPRCIPTHPAEQAQRTSNAFLEGRSQNLNDFKPGTRAIMLVFSDGDGTAVYRFPWYDRFRRWVEPWLHQVRWAGWLGWLAGLAGLAGCLGGCVP